MLTASQGFVWVSGFSLFGTPNELVSIRYRVDIGWIKKQEPEKYSGKLEKGYY